MPNSPAIKLALEVLREIQWSWHEEKSFTSTDIQATCRSGFYCVRCGGMKPNCYYGCRLDAAIQGLEDLNRSQSGQEEK